MKKWFCFTLIILSFFLSDAQEKNKQDYTVGLVLSGGGAKGLAHIGTLKVIDSLLMLARVGEMIPPWGVPARVGWSTSFSM